MIITFPIITPRMTPSEVRAEKWSKDLVAHGLVIISAEPIEAVVECDVPWVPEASRNDLQIRTIAVAAEDPSGDTPVVAGILVVLLIACGREDGWLGLWCPGWDFDAPQFTESPRSETVRYDGQAL